MLLLLLLCLSSAKYKQDNQKLLFSFYELLCRIRFNFTVTSSILWFILYYYYFECEKKASTRDGWRVETKKVFCLSFYTWESEGSQSMRDVVDDLFIFYYMYVRRMYIYNVTSDSRIFFSDSSVIICLWNICVYIYFCSFHLIYDDVDRNYADVDIKTTTIEVEWIWKYAKA